jgi:hypothetical protein
MLRYILAKVRVVHHFVDKGERVDGGGVYAEETDEIRV